VSLINNRHEKDMNSPVFTTKEAVTLVGGGETGPDDLSTACAIAPRLAAADAGAATLLAHDRMPEYVVGDMDSLMPRDAARLPEGILHRIAEQDTTDFDKAIRTITAPLILGVGFLGARLDHQLAALSVLARYPDRPVILLGRDEVVLHLPARITLPVEAGDIVSLMPLQPVTGRSTGLHWPIDGLTLTPIERIGTSNRATGPVTLDLDGPGLIGLMPRARLAALAQTYLAAAEPPVRA
jgi:thiamine pyrophosphokinase